ncbi:MAG: 3'-5' exonuclease, partial [Chitinophagales bacterium]
MISAVNKYNILFIDIETVSFKKSYTELTETFQKLWQKKHHTLIKDSEISFEESYTEKAAIYAEFGKIVCISCGYLTKSEKNDKLRIKSFSGDNETKLLKTFATLLSNNYTDTQNQTICGHNIKEFDIPYICRRMLINGIKLPEMLNIHGKKPWEVNFIDTLQL